MNDWAKRNNQSVSFSRSKEKKIEKKQSVVKNVTSDLLTEKDDNAQSSRSRSPNLPKSFKENLSSGVPEQSAHGQFSEILPNLNWQEDVDSESENDWDDFDEENDNEQFEEESFIDSHFLAALFPETPERTQISASEISGQNALHFNSDHNISTTSTWSLNTQLPTIIPFTGNSGLKIFPKNEEPIDYFFLIFSDKIFNLILEETNYQSQVLSLRNTSPKARIRGWRELTRSDFEVFLGLLYMSGQVHAPSYNHYWKNNLIYNYPLFRNAMSRDRFLLILRTLHFANIFTPEKAKPLNPLYKIKPLLNLFHNRMMEIYSPSKNLSIYESMLQWRGNLFFRQCIENKMLKFGLKFYMLSEPNGLVLNSVMYSASTEKVKGVGRHAEKIVKRLLHNYLGMGHAIYLDNFCSRLEITENLLQQNTYSTGILKPSIRGNPLLAIYKKLQGEIDTAYIKNGVYVLKWPDKSDIIIISSELGAEKIDHKLKFGKMLKKPETVINYNQLMGDIDQSDQLLAYYPHLRKTLRWYAKVGIHIFQLIMNNAFLLYNKYTPNKKLHLLEFRDSIITSLIYKNRPTLEAKMENLRNPKNVSYHTATGVPRNEKNRKIRKRCVICKKSGLRVESNYFCDLCPNKPGLCLTRCFAIYHGYKESD